MFTKPGSVETAIVLANGAELVSCIAREVVGNEVADTYAGSELTRSVIYNLAQTKFQSAVSNQIMKG